MAHNFKKFPELTDAQMDTEYFNSPHKQITESFVAAVTKVIDGDTIKVKWSERDFEFPIRFINIAAPELKENGGQESQKWLEKLTLKKTIEAKINKKNRVDKYGRLLANLLIDGLDVGEMSIMNGMSVPFSRIREGKIIDEIKLPKEFKQW